MSKSLVTTQSEVKTTISDLSKSVGKITTKPRRRGALPETIEFPLKSLEDVAELELLLRTPSVYEGFVS